MFKYRLKHKYLPKKIKNIIMPFLGFSLLLIAVGTIIILWTKYIIHKETVVYIKPQGLEVNQSTPFPIGVDPIKKEITENPLFDLYIQNHLSIDFDETRKNRWYDQLLAKITNWEIYQQLASPYSRTLVIYSGERKEEIAKNLSTILSWNSEEKKLFLEKITETEPILAEGKFFPGKYVVNKNATPEEVALLVNEEFNTEILNKYDENIKNKIPLNHALTIASLLEREAYDFTDMRIISGIIWNRLFIDMPLQLDASLQYARGSNSSEAKWWPKVRPADKYIKSPYNTYANKGLPPAPIANPSVESVIATLNPKQTDCLFYFHDPRGKFYCTKTYEDHVTMLKKVYGQGR